MIGKVTPDRVTPPDFENAPTLALAVSDLIAAFSDAGLETPSLDARRLVLGCLGLPPVALLREPERPVSLDERRRLSSAARRRLFREPVSRILGERAFHGLELEIGPSTLDPRPETETLVDGVLELVRQGRAPGGKAPRILDIGTGSGAILVALLHRLPGACGLGVDISEPALAIAARNASRHGLGHRAKFKLSTWLEAVDGQFDIIVSNPPYIPSHAIATLEPEVAYDPRPALDGGPDGLAPFRAIAHQCPRVLAHGGWLAVEVGVDQAGTVAQLLTGAVGEPTGRGVHIWTDLAGVSRCVAIEARL
jgi:release factor glutamine methyltransferase